MKSNDNLPYAQTSNPLIIPEANIPENIRNEHLREAASVCRDQSKKQDGGKLRMELIPPTALTSIARLLTHGAIKYGPNTWQSVEYERYVGAILRHLTAFIADPTGYDIDSGLPHIEHVLINAVFLNDAFCHGRIPPREEK
jgi:hypothetical protein